MKILHKKGFALTPLTLGTVQLGLNYGIANVLGKPDQAKSFALLRRSEQLGVNSFDTAAGYGESEIVLGRYFKQEINPDRLIVTKFKLPSTKEDLSAAQIEESLRTQLMQSLDRLGLTKIPVYLMHNPDDLHRYGDVLSQLLETLIAEDLIQMAGVSIYKGTDLDVMLRYNVFQATQIPINIFDQRLIRSGHLQRLQEAGILVFARSVFLQGLFFMDPDQLPDYLSEAAPLLRQLINLAAAQGISIAQLALSFVRDLAGIDSLVIGAETPEQVEANVALLASPVLPAKVIDLAKEYFNEVPEKIVNPGLWHNNDQFKK